MQGLTRREFVRVVIVPARALQCTARNLFKTSRS